VTANVDINERPPPDRVLIDIAGYVVDHSVDSDEAFNTARYCLLDTLGCGLLALTFPACARHLGPTVAGTIVPGGARVPGTGYVLDPVKAAWDIGCMIRCLDYNYTWLAAEWGHPSDNLGGILAVADFVSQQRAANGESPLTMSEVLTAMIKAHEIQGVIALENSFNRVGLDHVLLVKVASTAVVTHLLGGSREEIIDALSQAWVDGQALRTYRHAPNAGSRKSWAAGDATARAVQLALMTLRGEMGLPSVLTAPHWGFYDVLFKGKSFSFSRGFGSYVMENILFKVSFPAEFHAQTAVEAAVTLHPRVKDLLDEIERIDVTTHESAIRIISKVGPLANPADRDHCLQYMIAVPLLLGKLEAEHYEDDFHAANSAIDVLRDKMRITESPQYTADYLDPGKRSIANALQVHFTDGTSTDVVEVEYPVGHRRRRAEAMPLLEEKFIANAGRIFPADRVRALLDLCLDAERLSSMPVHEFARQWESFDNLQ